MKRNVLLFLIIAAHSLFSPVYSIDVKEDFKKLCYAIANVSYNLVSPEEATPSIISLYNTLRSQENLSTAATITEIDAAWIDYGYAKHVDNFVLTKTAQSLSALVQKIAAKLQMPMPFLITHKHHEEKNIAAECIATRYPKLLLKNTDHLEKVQFTLYHEFGHFVNNDIEINPDQKRLSLPEYNNDIQEVAGYTELGKKAFSSASPLDAYVQKILARPDTHDGFWKTPTDKNAKNLFTYFRTTEKRADLFALKQLLHDGSIKAIVHALYRFLHQKNIIALSTSKHPSCFERALYTAGFLKAHRYDPSALLMQYALKGTSSSLRAAYNKEHMLRPFIKNDRSPA